MVVQNDPTHPDNYGHVVTHVGMNIDELLKRFRQFENDDQRFWEEVTGGKEPDPPKEILDGSARLKLHEDMVVQSEIVEQLFEESFTTAEDADIQHDLEKKLELLGLDPNRCVHHHVGRDGVVDRADLRFEFPRDLDAVGLQTNSVEQYLRRTTGGGRKRLEWSFEEFVAATETLPDVLNNLVRQLKRAQDD